MVLSRAFQPVLMLLLLAPFVLAIVAGLLGTPAGNRNFGIVFVWIVWWALLMVLLVPGLGRVWCTVCPIPAPGEWMQRRSIIGGVGKLRNDCRRQNCHDDHHDQHFDECESATTLDTNH